MGVNKPINKKELKDVLIAFNTKFPRIIGWCKTYEEFEEFNLQKEKRKTICNEAKISNHNEPDSDSGNRCL